MCAMHSVSILIVIFVMTCINCTSNELTAIHLLLHHVLFCWCRSREFMKNIAFDQWTKNEISVFFCLTQQWQQHLERSERFFGICYYSNLFLVLTNVHSKITNTNWIRTYGVVLWLSGRQKICTIILIMIEWLISNQIHGSDIDLYIAQVQLESIFLFDERQAMNKHRTHFEFPFQNFNYSLSSVAWEKNANS